MTAASASSRSSEGWNVRPAIGITRKTSKNRADTVWMATCSPAPSPTAITRLFSQMPAIESKVRFLATQSTTSYGPTTRIGLPA